MTEIAFLMGRQSETYFFHAKAYFDSLFAGTASKVVTPEELSLDAILELLAVDTTTYSVVHVVTHSFATGSLGFPLSLDPLDHPSWTRLDGLNRALDDWKVKEAEEAAAALAKPAKPKKPKKGERPPRATSACWKPLWARGPAGSPPVSVDKNTIIEIDGCDIGLNPSATHAVGEMFAKEGTVRASIRVLSFASGTKPAVMGQVRSRSYIDPTFVGIPTGETERESFNLVFASKFVSRAKSTPEGKALPPKSFDRTIVEFAVEGIAARAVIGYDTTKPGWVTDSSHEGVREVPKVMTLAEAIKAASFEITDPAVTAAPLPPDSRDADDACFPIRYSVSPLRYAITHAPVFDPKTSKTVDGTVLRATFVQVVLFEPILNSAKDWIQQVDPTDTAAFAVATFVARAPKEPPALAPAP